jgi:3-oxoacyl-[acyl-carrier-protein] synthase II
MRSTKQRRVVITGMGLVTPVGIGVEDFWNNIVAGVSGVERSKILVDSDCPWKIAAEVKDFHPEQWMDRKDAARMDRFAHFGLVSARLAEKDAQLNLDKENRERVGVSIGTAYSGVHFQTQQHVVYMKKGIRAISPFAGVAVFSGSCGAMISLHLGVKAPSITIATGCESSAAALAHAVDFIVNSEADVMFAGGADATVHPLIVAAMGQTRALSDRNDEPTKASRPFDARRDGFVMAEGGAVLVLEELEHARLRGARIYAEIAGWGTTCDAHHISQPCPNGTEGIRALQLALGKAGIRPEEVDYVNAHGTSTRLGDKAETAVLKHVFGEHAYRMPVSSIKSCVGHMQGACGIAEVAACVLTIRDSILPPTINYENPDPACDLDYVPNKARHHRVNIAVKNSFGFGGRNTAIVLRRYQNGHAAVASGKRPSRDA